MDKRYVSNLAFVDLLFNLILGFVMLFLISFLLITKSEKTADVEHKAEILIVMNWDDMHEGDMDLWVETPNGKVSYVSPQAGQVYLDKDDLGVRNDQFVKPNGETVFIRINREIVTLRAKQPGEYVVNAQYYATPTNNGYNAGSAGPATVTVEVIQLNPFQIVHSSSKMLRSRGDEVTFLRFKINAEGEIHGINYLPKSLVRSSISP